mmetsp:Transcript_2671/g.9554  ORF Transcript_2671/g.9554 Transcript_2671/m.9554 type:complete len:286 (-) Transcript_2671:101-958(-)
MSLPNLKRRRRGPLRAPPAPTAFCPTSRSAPTRGRQSTGSARSAPPGSGVGRASRITRWPKRTLRIGEWRRPMSLFGRAPRPRPRGRHVTRRRISPASMTSSCSAATARRNTMRRSSSRPGTCGPTVRWSSTPGKSCQATPLFLSLSAASSISRRRPWPRARPHGKSARTLGWTPAHTSCRRALCRRRRLRRRRLRRRRRRGRPRRGGNSGGQKSATGKRKSGFWRRRKRRRRSRRRQSRKRWMTRRLRRRRVSHRGQRRVSGRSLCRSLLHRRPRHRRSSRRRC